MHSVISIIEWKCKILINDNYILYFNIWNIILMTTVQVMIKVVLYFLNPLSKEDPDF